MDRMMTAKMRSSRLLNCLILSAWWIQQRHSFCDALSIRRCTANAHSRGARPSIQSAPQLSSYSSCPRMLRSMQTPILQRIHASTQRASHVPNERSELIPSSSLQSLPPTKTTDPMESTDSAPIFAGNRKRRTGDSTSEELFTENLLEAVKLIVVSIAASIALISWEEVSMVHPMRTQINRVEMSPSIDDGDGDDDGGGGGSDSKTEEVFERNRFRPPIVSSAIPTSPTFGASTLRGMGFGTTERNRDILEDIEPSSARSIRSYNEIMLQHRQQRVTQWNIEASSITEGTVQASVATIQRALILVLDCKLLAQDYEWEELRQRVRDPLLQEQLQKSCALLQSAKEYLGPEARQEIGFGWSSCAWRHCGAFADAQEAIDELDYAVGMLEPFECAFVIDVLERSLRDILDVSKAYQDSDIAIPPYQQLTRMSDMADEGASEFTNDDMDYLEALSNLRSFDADDDDDDGDE